MQNSRQKTDGVCKFMQRKVIVETDGPVAELGLSRNGTGDGGDTGEPEHWQYVGPRPETELFPELELR